MLTQFDRDCALINIYFQNRPNPDERRAVRQVTSWDDVYLVQFYWGHSKFISKNSDWLGEVAEKVPSGLFREYCDPVTLKKANTQERKIINSQATKRWTKEQHNQWLESQELYVRRYWAYKKYSEIETSSEQIEVMTAFAVLGLQPFCLTAQIKKAFRELALRFHPDRGGNEDAFQFLKGTYQKALLYAKDYLLVSNTSEGF